MQVDVTRFTHAHTEGAQQEEQEGQEEVLQFSCRDLITEAQAAADAAHAKTIQIQTLREQTLSEGGR